MADETVTTTTETPPQVDPRDAEITRLKADAERFQPLRHLADALEADPAKYFAVQAALEGGTPAPAAPPPPPVQQQITADQRAQLEIAARDNPLEFFARMADAVASQRINDVMQTSGASIAAATAENTIENFKTRKAAQDPLYKQILPVFERQLGDVDRTTFLGLNASARNRTLELRWDAASGEVYRKAAATAAANPAPTLGAGGGGGESQGKKTVLESDAIGRSLAQQFIDQGLLSEEDTKEVEETIKGRVGSGFGDFMF